MPIGSMMLLRNEEEREQFTRFYLKYESLMFKTARLILDNQEDCEDAVQSSCAHLIDHFEKMASYDSAQIASYIVLLIRNRSIDILRKQKKICYEDIEQYSESILTEDVQAKCLPLENAFARLPERYKEVLTLYYYNDLKTREIAQMWEMSDFAVRKLLQRSRDALKKLITEERCGDK